MSYYTPEDLTFLSSIGYKPRELFDFVEDLGDSNEPSESTALLVAAARRDHFLVVQHGQASQTQITKDDIPSREADFQGLPYLPRITEKAVAKLKGELHPDLMFGCGGDRRFLRANGDICPADFLRQVWASEGDLAKVADFVRQSLAH